LTSLAVLLGAVMTVLQSNPLCRKIINVETKEFSPRQFFFKIRAAIIALEKITLQIRIYYNHGHIDYSYQIFSDMPLYRWDNKEEFRYLATFPHHFHDKDGFVKQSPLLGDPSSDIQIVLQEMDRLAGCLEKK
jgi:hypothetical protein